MCLDEAEFFIMTHRLDGLHEYRVQGFQRVVLRGQPHFVCAHRNLRGMFKYISEALYEQCARHAGWPVAAGGRMMSDPVPCNVEPGCDPDLVVALDIIEKPFQRRGAPGPASEPA